MKFNQFLNFLNTKDRISFISNAALEKLMVQPKRFRSLRNYQNFLTQVEALGFQVSSKDENITLVKSNRSIQLRRKSSDFEVFKQVYINREYQSLIDVIKDNNICVNTVIDAGSNIGLTTLKLMEYFEDAKFICLEPDAQNYKQLQINTGCFSQNVISVNKALWGKEEKLFMDFSFRDGLDWSKSVTNNQKDSAIKVEACTIASLMKDYSLDEIDLLKIDIEGGEVALFGHDSNLSFLEKVKVIAIEIHDEFNCREGIYKILKDWNFIIFNSKELTIGIRSCCL